MVNEKLVSQSMNCMSFTIKCKETITTEVSLRLHVLCDGSLTPSTLVLYSGFGASYNTLVDLKFGFSERLPKFIMRLLLEPACIIVLALSLIILL